MSDTTTQTNENETNKELTERLNKAYIANSYTLLNGGTDNIIMIRADKDGKDPVDVLLTLSGMEEVAAGLRSEADAAASEKRKSEETDGHEE